MKNYGKIVLSFCIILSIANHSHSQKISLPYDYPIKPGTDEWKNLRSQDEMIEACQIPAELLKKLTTEALVISCLRYPLYPQINAYNSIQHGFDRLASKFNGFQELQKRPDGFLALFNVYKTMDPMQYSKDWTLIRKGQFMQEFMFVEILMAQEPLVANVDSKIKKQALQECQKKYESKFQEGQLYGLIGLSHTGYLMVKIVNPDNLPSDHSGIAIRQFMTTASPVSAQVLQEVNGLVTSYLAKE